MRDHTFRVPLKKLLPSMVVAAVLGGGMGAATTYYAVDRNPSFPIVIEASSSPTPDPRAEAFWRARTDVYKTCLARGNSSNTCADSARKVVPK